MSSKSIVWLVGLGLLGAACVAATMVVGGDRRMLLVGRTTDAHHQIEMTCETCHAASPFAGTAAAEKALNGACRSCHEAELTAADDSHPRKTFRNPRMAAFLERLDARLCTSCHVEHRPEITRAGAVTVAMDFCAACHSEGEQDVRRNRPSHAGLAFDTCASAGCHNYHDNRALYEDFLAKHAEGPALAPSPTHALTALFPARERPADKALGRDDAVAAEAVRDAYSERYGRVGALTGIPIVLGWENHERQWRGATYYKIAGSRRQDMEALYTAENLSQISHIIDRYRIGYILYGLTELSQYGGAGEEKFRDHFPVACQSNHSRIYAVRPGDDAQSDFFEV